MVGVFYLLHIPLICLFALVIKKVGYSGWWVLLGLIWPVGLIALWVFALARWPVDDQNEISSMDETSQPADAKVIFLDRLEKNCWLQHFWFIRCQASFSVARSLACFSL